MDEESFRKIFQRFIEKKSLEPETARRLLQRILKILFPDSKLIYRKGEKKDE